MKKLVSLGIVTLATLSLAACGNNNSTNKDSSSSKARSESVAKAKMESKAEKESLARAKSESKTKADRESKAKAASESSAKAASEAAASSSAAAASSQAAASSSQSDEQSSQQNTMQNSPSDSNNNKVNNDPNAGTSVTSVQQAQALVQAQIGNGDPSDPITWNYMTTSPSNLMTDDNGDQYYWIRGQRQSSIEAFKKSGAGSYDGLDYYVYTDGRVVAQ